MFSFGITIVALAALVAPGVLFIICFFSFSIIRRAPSISFGPAIDVAAFFAISILINAAYGGALAHLESMIFHPCGPYMLHEVAASINSLIYGGTHSGTCTFELAASFFYIYLLLLCLAACLIGFSSIVVCECLGIRFASSAFSKLAQCARSKGITNCSALCKFGGDHSFVIYVGTVEEMALNDRNFINYLVIRNIQRSLLKIHRRIDAAAAEDIPTIGSNAEFVIPGEAIENISFSYTQGDLRLLYRQVIASMVILTVPILFSAVEYAHLVNDYASELAKGGLPP